MAAASSDVFGSSGKSGKGGARLADGGDYDWVLGRYTKCQRSGFLLTNGDPFEKVADQNCDADELVIERLGDDPKGLTFQASYLTPMWRRYYEGVGSYNSKYIDEITFYNDHAEMFNGTSWVSLGAQESDVSTMRVSRLDGYPSSVVADTYGNWLRAIPGFPSVQFVQFEILATLLFTDVDSERE